MARIARSSLVWKRCFHWLSKLHVSNDVGKPDTPERTSSIRGTTENRYANTAGKAKLCCCAWKYLVRSGTMAGVRIGKKRVMIDRATGNGSESFEVWAQV